jgi:dipeptidase E
MQQQIVAMSGGRFSEGCENLSLETFILRLANKPRPKICFLPTASGDSEQYLLKFYTSFARLSANPAHLLGSLASSGALVPTRQQLERACVQRKVNDS